MCKVFPRLHVRNPEEEFAAYLAVCERDVVEVSGSLEGLLARLQPVLEDDGCDTVIWHAGCVLAVIRNREILWVEATRWELV
jgi:hypothetical protein